MAQRVVLIVASNQQIREVFHDIFLTAGYECLLAADGREGVEIFRGWRPQLVVTDLNLPVMSGVELLQQVRQEDPDAAVIVVCGSVVKQDEKVVGFLDVEGTRSASLKLGAYAFLEKPMDMEELLLAAERALERRRLLIERRLYQELLERRGAGRFPASPLRAEPGPVEANEPPKPLDQASHLDRRWGAIRPMVDVSELLAVFAAVFARRRP